MEGNNKMQRRVSRSKNESQVFKDLSSKKDSLRVKLKQMYKSVDQFGQNVNFTYGGEDSFKTILGATATYIIAIILIYFAQDKLRHLITRDNPIVLKTSFFREMQSADPYRPQDQGFSFSFGLDVELDQSYGYFTAKAIEINSTGILNNLGTEVKNKYS